MATVTAATLNDLLKSIEKPKGKGKKGDVPIITVDITTQRLVDTLITAKEDMASATAKYKAVEQSFLNVVEPIREGMCAEELITSVKVPSTGERLVTSTWPSKFSEIHDLDRVKELVGEAYSELFSEKVEISVKDDATEADVISLVRALGPKRFVELFQTKTIMKPTKKYVENFHKDKVLFTAEKKAELKLLVPQNKASVKI